ncbi:sister chromatid cohesion protein PDS5 homolog C-like isoform X2 [Malania oleifera]|uniref:sister chromatid cohesion protein PDS5 homolog C-like isoform X2 n=1 Tax=Malania oleifera TaxID=397392 RepID=UPI0025ADBA61|nr:sister chromatid cohesion protein PDS5 homolog C-like isoform X2 [Malania oleifera]
MVSSSDRELEEQLLDAGNRLLQPLSSVYELLPILDQVENCLTRVEQSPPKSMQNALSPSLKALISDELLRHSDVDVKVAVAACISEITRITAPDAPYDDDQMKEVFQLIVSSFENLSDKSSRSYNKRTSILETVAKVRSCVVMLDLECDALIVEMFQQFFKSIRDHHPEAVFTSMETIMTLVLEESEDISVELLIPILASVKNDNEEILPIARKLGKKVLKNCADKLKPYLIQAVKSLGIFLEDYSKVVASICLEKSGAVEEGDVNVSGENQADEGRMVRASSDEAAQLFISQVADKISKEAVCPKEVDPAVDRSQKFVMSNGVSEAPRDDSLLDSNSSKKLNNQSQSINARSKSESGDRLVDYETKTEQSSKRRGKKQNSVMNSAEPSDFSHIDGDKEAEKLPNRQKSRSMQVHNSPREGSSAEAAAQLENEKDAGVWVSSPKASEREAVNVASSTPNKGLPDESRSRKGGRPKKKEGSTQEAKPTADIAKKASEGVSDSEVKPHRRAGKKVPTEIADEDRTPVSVDTIKKRSKTAGESEGKQPKSSWKKVELSNNNEDGPSIKQQEDGKRRVRGKAILEKDGRKSLAGDEDKSATKSTKGEFKMEEISKVNSKRKRTPGKEKTPDVRGFGENLVGLMVKVWWPKDEMFYEGRIESFDPAKKKHRVVYTDGDEEKLFLRKEKWEIIEGESVPDEAADHPSPDASPEMQRKKAKTNSDVPTKPGQIDASSKKVGGTSSGKPKVASAKTGRKLKDDGKNDGKSQDSASKKTEKSEDVNGGKSKGHTAKSGSKASDDAARAASKSRDDDPDTPKTSNKSKQVTPKTVMKSKGKTLKSGNKSNANGTGKMKSGSSKVKEDEDTKEKSPDSGKALSGTKGKSPDSSKAQDGESKSGKKRRRN